LLGFAISQKLVLLPEYKTAYIALTKKELNDYNYQVGDTEGVVNYALSIEGVMVAVLLTERKDRIRLSFRSKGNFSVNQIAREHFKGGGHMNAAGGDSFKSMDDTISALKKVLGQYKMEIDRSSF
jgi:phosphoesterase RecJ-like protein